MQIRNVEQKICTLMCLRSRKSFQRDRGDRLVVCTTYPQNGQPVWKSRGPH